MRNPHRILSSHTSVTHNFALATPESMVYIAKELEDATPADYVAANLTPTLTKGLAELCLARPKDPVTWLAEWLGRIWACARQADGCAGIRARHR